MCVGDHRRARPAWPKMGRQLRPASPRSSCGRTCTQATSRCGGEWIETRLLASGGRTNPWFREASTRVIQAGELVAFDTDLVGPFGYCADVSRTYFCEPPASRPTSRAISTTYAYEQVAVQHRC